MYSAERSIPKEVSVDSDTTKAIVAPFATALDHCVSMSDSDSSPSARMPGAGPLWMTFRVPFGVATPNMFQNAVQSDGLMSVSATIAMVCPVPSMGGFWFHRGSTL